MLCGGFIIFGGDNVVVIFGGDWEVGNKKLGGRSWLLNGREADEGNPCCKQILNRLYKMSKYRGIQVKQQNPLKHMRDQ